MNSSSVEKSSNVTIHYSLTLADQTHVDSTNPSLPITFTLGKGMMISAFEDAMLGMIEGESKEIIFPPKEAFGFPEESNHLWIEKDKFDTVEDTLIQGLMIEFNTSAGDRLSGIVMEIQDDKVLMDFNHPLAGHELNFKVDILQINF